MPELKKSDRIVKQMYLKGEKALILVDFIERQPDKSFKKEKSKKYCAFSLAEAMVTLLIVSVALAAAAPIISKNMNKSSQGGQINTYVDVPVGAIMFFHPGVTGYKRNSLTNPCPPGWKQVPKNFNKRFIRITDGRSGSTNFGVYQEDAFKEHVHISTWGENIVSYSSGEIKNYPWGYYWPDGATGIAGVSNKVGSHGGFDSDNAWSYTSPAVLRTKNTKSPHDNGYTAKILTGDEYNETRPKNVSLLACVKGDMPDNYEPKNNTIDEITGFDR